MSWCLNAIAVKGTRPARLGALLLGVVLMLAGCTGVPEGVTPVTGFDLSRYLGTWHEIARLDHSFERGLSRVTATYSLNADGSVKVVNRGYDAAAGEWKDAEGVARFLGEPTTASLKVSFFGPFYGGYHVLALDSDYQWALVSGYNRDYLWILARTPTLPDAVTDRLVKQAAALGFAVEQLIWVNP